MSKQIPYIFEDATFYRELAPINNLHNVGRSRVRAFYKGKNRNGSFINEEVTNILINSAMKGNTPVIGFYNHEMRDFERHMGPELAKGYGYIPQDCNFAWEDHEDEQGIMRTYACFDCILFCDYFEEANEIVGKPQSMELNKETIVGDWKVLDDGEEYFVYSFAEIKGFCVLGSNIEPCFESAAFFEKSSESKFDKFSLLLSDLMERVKEAQEGGEQTMENEQVIETVEEQVENFEEEPKQVEEEVAVEVEEEKPEMVNKDQFDALQNEYNSLEEKFKNLEDKFNNLQNDYDQAKKDLEESNIRVNELNTNMADVQSKFEEIKIKADEYEKQINQIDMEKKEKLVSDYEKVLSEEEINEIKPHIIDFSFDELESKLAVSYSRKNVGLAANRIPTPEPEQTDFEKLISKYKK